MRSMYLKNTYKTGASWHYTVDSKSIYQHLPLDMNGCHATDGVNGTGNRKSIAIEMCINSDGDYSKTLHNTIDLCRYLLELYPNAKTVQHNYWKSIDYPKGKNCPRKLRAMNKWNWFIEQVYKEDIKQDVVPEWKYAGISYLSDIGIIYDPERLKENIDGNMSVWEVTILMAKLHQDILDRLRK